MQLSFNINLADQNPPLPEFAELIRKKRTQLECHSNHDILVQLVSFEVVSAFTKNLKT